MKQTKKAQLETWFFVLLLLFAIGLIYLILTPAYTGVSEAITPMLNGSHQGTVDKINTTWDNWPIISILVLFVAGFILMVRRQ